MLGGSHLLHHLPRILNIFLVFYPMLCVLWAHDTSSPPAGCGPISPSADAFAAVNAKCEKPIYLWDKRHDDVGSKRNGEDYTTLSSYYNTSALFAVWLGVYAL